MINLAIFQIKLIMDQINIAIKINIIDENYIKTFKISII